MYGEARLRKLVGRDYTTPGGELIDRLIGDIHAFTGRSEFDDDICALAVESTGSVCALRPATTYEV